VADRIAELLTTLSSSPGGDRIRAIPRPFDFDFDFARAFAFAFAFASPSLRRFHRRFHRRRTPWLSGSIAYPRPFMICGTARSSAWVRIRLASATADPSQQNGPDHLAIMAVAVLYESGVVGALALAFGFFALLWMLLRASADGTRRGLAAAYAAAIMSLLVAYQATNAIHFATTGSSWAAPSPWP